MPDVFGERTKELVGVGAQERIDQLLLPDGAWQRGSSGGPLSFAVPLPVVAFGILWLCGARKPQIGQGVFVRAIDAGLRRQIGQSLQRRMELLGGAAEQAATAGTEQSVAREQDARGKIGDMGSRVAGYFEYVEADSQCVE